MASAGQATSSALQEMLKEGALAGSWTLDASRSTVGLRSKSMWGLAPVKGTFREIAGTGTVTADGQVSGTVMVASASVDTKIAKRDTHLRSAEFFDSDTHPHITVRVDRITPARQGVTVTGTLTVRDQTRPVTFDADVSAVDPNEVWLDAEIRVNRADFGLTWNQFGMASMHNTITIHAVFTRS
jgi:polyisoprenoid-binding protein YceI